MAAPRTLKKSSHQKRIVTTPDTTGSDYRGPSDLSQLDYITIAGQWKMPLVNGSLDAGTRLDSEMQKGKGTDYKRIIGMGYDTLPVKFDLLLFRDMNNHVVQDAAYRNYNANETVTFPGDFSINTGFAPPRKNVSRSGNMDWFLFYDEYVRDILMPKALNKRNAVAVDHPFLKAEGITSIVVDTRMIPRHIGSQFFVVHIEGWDTRFARFGAVGPVVVKMDKKGIDSNGTHIGAKGPLADDVVHPNGNVEKKIVHGPADAFSGSAGFPGEEE